MFNSLLSPSTKTTRPRVFLRQESGTIVRYSLSFQLPHSASAPAQAGLLVPLLVVRIHAGRFPEALSVAWCRSCSCETNRILSGNPLRASTELPVPLTLAGSVGRADDDESLCITAASGAETVSMNFFSASTNAPAAHRPPPSLHFMAGGSDRNGLDLVAALFFKSGDQQIQQSGILGAGVVARTTVFDVPHEVATLSCMTTRLSTNHFFIDVLH